MRLLLGLAVVGLAACGSDNGAILTFTGGPETASRIQIVLASADAETIGTGIRQRMQPGLLGEEDVIYYRQRTRGGMVRDVDAVEGFQVRIEPEVDVAPDEQFIPFALVFDAASELIAVGAVLDTDGNPMPVTIRDDQRILYPMTLTTLTTPGADVALAVNQGVVVGCRDDHDEAWTSGVAWRPATGPQLRLLLADIGADPDATDATARAADLDCDAHDAADDDCDDLRSAFHPGQAETCDGLDTDCDGRRMELQTCSLPNLCGGAGVQVCVDQGTTIAPTQCMPDAACACASQTGCSRCLLSAQSGSAGGGPTRIACAPAIGKLHLDTAFCSEGCQVEVLAADGGFEMYVGAAELGPFADHVTLANGNLYLRAKYGGPDFPAPTAPTSVGQAYLAVSNASRTMAVSVDLEITADMNDVCPPATLANNSAMYCMP